MTPFAVPGPSFPTVIRNPTASPPSTTAASAVFVTKTSGQFTVIVALSESAPSFDVVTLAVLFTSPQLPTVVGEVMCAALLRPEPRSPKSQVSTPLVIEQPASLLAASTDQSSPPFVGNVSVTVTPWAVPSPLLVTSIVNPMLSPAVTVPWSGVFVIAIAGQFTVIVAVDRLSPTLATDSFEAATTAVFGSVPQSVASVAPVTCTVRVAPSARSPKAQVRTPAAIEQSAESSLQTIPVGSVSVRVTSFAVPGPSLVTRIVNAAVSPASIVPWSAVLSTVTFGQATVTDALSESDPSFDVVTLAVLSTAPHVAAVVGEVRCTCLLAPEARVPKLQVRTPAVSEQPESLPAASIVQFRPASVGSVSLTVTPEAEPAPLLVTVIRNPIGSPALTVPWSAVLVMLIVAQFTVIVAVSELSVWSEPSLSAATVAVFESVPQSWASVTPETWMVFDVPSSRVANVQVRVPDEIEHPVTAGSIDHATPAGKGSFSVTLLAVPGPLFVTTIVNAAVSPALIVPWSAVLVTEMLGCTTAMALGWMLRSWFLFALPSSCCVRMCHGAPLIVAAPLAAPPLDSFQ